MTRRRQKVLGGTILLFGLGLGVSQTFSGYPSKLLFAVGFLLVLLSMIWISDRRLWESPPAPPYDWEGRDYWGPFEVVTDRTVPSGRIRVRIDRRQIMRGAR